jgi:hypothetical protein
MKKISHYEVSEYTYDTRQERDNHIADLYEEGWRDEGKIRKLKDNVSIMDAQPEDYEWYARLMKFNQ